MDIVVCLKQVPDLQQIRIKADTREPVLEGAPFVFGDMEKNAVEEAVRLVERSGGKVIALAAGSDKLGETVLDILAMGADEAVLLTDGGQDCDAASTAVLLAGALQRIGAFDLVLMGEGSADNYSGQVPARVAEILALPLITYVRQLEVIGGDRLRAVRDLEEHLETVECPLPAVLTVTSEINQPRLPTLPNILKARRKPTVRWTLQDLGLAGDQVGPGACLVEAVRSLAPTQSRKGVLFEGEAEKAVEGLVSRLAADGALSG